MNQWLPDVKLENPEYSDKMFESGFSSWNVRYGAKTSAAINGALVFTHDKDLRTNSDESN